jgi:hydroxyacylglutathione hydrolase
MRVIPVPALADNYIWLLADAAGNALIVDPGEAAPVLSALQREQLAPSGILLTHHHPDHIGGVPGIRAQHPGLPVVAPHDPRITTATRRVSDGERVVFAAPNASFEVIEIPGHTLSHIAFHAKRHRVRSDTMFSVGCGRLFRRYAGADARVARSPRGVAGRTQLCCGHEYTLPTALLALSVDPDNVALRERNDAVRALRSRGAPTLPVTLSTELATNPFLRVDSSALREACSAAIGADAAQDRIARFAWLRRAKDQFRAT